MDSSIGRVDCSHQVLILATAGDLTYSGYRNYMASLNCAPLARLNLSDAQLEESTKGGNVYDQLDPPGDDSFKRDARACLTAKNTNWSARVDDHRRSAFNGFVFLALLPPLVILACGLITRWVRNGFLDH